MSKMTRAYESQYQLAAANLDYIVKSLAERSIRPIHMAIEVGGEDAVQALFDAVLDKGHREVLVRAIDSPSLPGWVRERLEVFLYGQRRQSAALFMQKKTIH